MRNKIYGKQLSRGRGSRKALFRSLIWALVEHGKIKTTKAKAKAIQPDVDKIMKLVKQDSVSARRRTLKKLANNRQITKKLFSDYKALAKSRNSGFTRVISLPSRKGDNAELAILEWVEQPSIPVVAKKPAKKVKTSVFKKITRRK